MSACSSSRTSAVATESWGRRGGDPRGRGRLAPRTYRPERCREVDSLQPDLWDGAASVAGASASSARMSRDAARTGGRDGIGERSSTRACSTICPRGDMAMSAQRSLDLRTTRCSRPARLHDVDARSRRAAGARRARPTSEARGRIAVVRPPPSARGGVALATEPRLLLLDEPTAGMSGDEAQRFMAVIGGLPQELTLMIVEHDMDVVFELATMISVSTPAG